MKINDSFCFFSSDVSNDFDTALVQDKSGKNNFLLCREFFIKGNEFVSMNTQYLCNLDLNVLNFLMDAQTSYE